METPGSLMETLRCVMEANKKMCENQKRILSYLGGIDKRLTNLENATKTSNPTENAVTRETVSDENVMNFQQLSQDIQNVETRLDIVETELIHFKKEMCDSEIMYDRTEGEVNSRDNQDASGGILQIVDHLSIGSFSDQDTSLGCQADSRSYFRKGSFKAASLAIVFVNRLMVQAPSTIHLSNTENLTVRSGADNLKRAIFAIIFMIKLMKALNLPRIIKHQRDVNPD